MALQVEELLPSFVSTVAPPTLTVDWGTAPARDRGEVRWAAILVVLLSEVVVMVVVVVVEGVIGGKSGDGDDFGGDDGRCVGYYCRGDTITQLRLICAYRVPPQALRH